MRVTTELLDGKNYQDWSHSAQLVIGGAKWLGQVDGTITEPPMGDLKYLDWQSGNMLVVNYIHNIMGNVIAARFCYCKSAKEYWTQFLKLMHI